MQRKRYLAENRDKIQLIREYSKQKKFDILLVFMFDRIGRISDKTPFVVEWFVRNGIRVWSIQEGEQRFDRVNPPYKLNISCRSSSDRSS